MARPRTYDEAQVLDRALTVFCRHGYDGSTINDLTGAIGLRAPSIYAAFGSKRGLFAAVLQRCIDSSKEHLDWVLSAPSADEVVQRLLFSAAEQLPPMAPISGGLLVQGGFVASLENADIPAALGRCREANEMMLRVRFEQAKIAGELAVRADPKALASFVMAVLDGMTVKAAAGATVGALRKIAEEAAAGWRASAVARADEISINNSTIERRAVGPGRPLAFRPSDALEAAMHVFWRKGYEGASLTDLTEAMGITRPSLYAAFGNKEELFLKALDRYQRENMAYARKAMEAPTVREVVEQLLAGAVAAQLSDEQPRGCMAIANSMQGGDDARVIRAEVLRRIEEAHTAFVARLERAKAEGDLPDTADPEGVARLIDSVMQEIATMGSAGATADQFQALIQSTLSLPITSY
jgi:TetR/AcrR family transcriptional regulator, copper-responsive repressor